MGKFGAARMQGMSDLASDTGDGVTIMDLLKSNHPEEWKHLLERKGDQIKAAGLETA